MSKLLIGVGGVLTVRQESIIKEKIKVSMPDIDVIVVPFMNGSCLIEDIDSKNTLKQVLKTNNNRNR